MNDVQIRVENRTGRITLNRPKALNALTYEMCLAIDAALRAWRDDPEVDQVLLDAAGEKAFCAGGDIAELYATGTRGDFGYGRRFWRDEYRMNARISAYPKPVVSFLQGYVMGGGVGLGCHGSLRIVGETSRVAMPECGIGLVPDVGGSAILARMEGRAPGLGAWVGASGLRLAGAEATLGFADRFCSEPMWEDLKSRMIADSAPTVAIGESQAGPSPELADMARMAAHFAEGTPAEILESLSADASEAAQTAAKALGRACPLSVACHIEMLRRLGPETDIREALKLEYRFTWRCMERGDFLEGIRAQIIDKDRSPRWRHNSLAEVTAREVDAMLAPLGEDELTFED